MKRLSNQFRVTVIMITLIMSIGVTPGLTLENGFDEALNLNEVDQRPLLLSRVSPVYPDEARQQRITGKVSVKFIVDRGGNVKNPAIIRSEPSDVFDQSVIEAVLKWRFKPAIHEGKPVNTRLIVPIRFDL